MKIKVEIYQTETGKEPFSKWLKKQTKLTRSLIVKRILKLRNGYLGDYKAIKGVKGLFELRAHQGPGYRLYFGKKGETFVLLLCGGTKSTQTSDIEKAENYWEDWQERS